MIAATIGFVIVLIIAIFLSIVTLGVLSWPGGKGEKIVAVIVCALVWCFVSYINPFYVQITVTGP